MEAKIKAKSNKSQLKIANIQLELSKCWLDGKSSKMLTQCYKYQKN